MKSLFFIFDGLPTFNGRVSAPRKQTVGLGVHRRPAAAALAVSWITGSDGAAVKKTHTHILSSTQTATVHRALFHFPPARRQLQRFQMSELRFALEPLHTGGSVRWRRPPASAPPQPGGGAATAGFKYLDAAFWFLVFPVVT